MRSALVCEGRNGPSDPPRDHHSDRSPPRGFLRSGGNDSSEGIEYNRWTDGEKSLRNQTVIHLWSADHPPGVGLGHRSQGSRRLVACKISHAGPRGGCAVHRRLVSTAATNSPVSAVSPCSRVRPRSTLAPAKRSLLPRPRPVRGRQARAGRSNSVRHVRTGREYRSS